LLLATAPWQTQTETNVAGAVLPYVSFLQTAERTSVRPGSMALVVRAGRGGFRRHAVTHVDTSN